MLLWSWIHAEMAANLAHFHISVLLMTQVWPKCQTSSLLCSVVLLPHKTPFFFYVPKHHGFTLNQREHPAAKQVWGFQDSLITMVQDQWLLQGSGCLMFNSTGTGPPLLRLHTAAMWLLQFWCYIDTHPTEDVPPVAVLCRSDRCLQPRYHSQFMRQLPQCALKFNQILGLSCVSTSLASPQLSFLISWTMECSSPVQVLSLDGNFFCVSLLISPNFKMLWDKTE